MSFDLSTGKADFLGDTLRSKSGGHRLKRGFLKFAILELLIEQPRHGYEIIKELEQRYAGTYRPSAGSVYPNLQLLEEDNSLTSQEAEGKKIYTITEQGRKQLEEHRQHQADKQIPLPSNSDTDQSHIPEIKQSTSALIETIRYVAHFGTPNQIRELKKILDATSRQLHALLAREEGEL